MSGMLNITILEMMQLLELTLKGVTVEWKAGMVCWTGLWCTGQRPESPQC